MQELIVFVPEYTISPEILKNISSIEYGRAIVENKKILSHWEKQLKKQGLVRSITHSLGTDDLSADPKEVKKYIDGISKNAPIEVSNYKKVLESVDKIVSSKELDEVDVKDIHRKLTDRILPHTRQGMYRSSKTKTGVNPEEILAQMVELFDWYSSRDAQLTHPILSAGLVHCQILQILPFENMNYSIANIISKIILKINGYNLNDYSCFEQFLDTSKHDYRFTIKSAHVDQTEWLEFFTDGLAREFSNIKEKIILLARDSKIAKASGRVELTQRQEKVVEFLQDYGILQNKDFNKLFPKISEDSVLRDLKVLINKGIVVKRGKTKSSRYELR